MSTKVKLTKTVRLLLMKMNMIYLVAVLNYIARYIRS